MTQIWDYFKNFFREAEESSASRPILSEPLERSQEELAAYEKWKDTLPCRRLLDMLAAQYAIFQSNPSGVDAALTFLKTDSSNGFAFHFDRLDGSPSDAANFLDYLKEKTQSLNYRLQHADTRTWTEKDWVKTVERYYLKPRQNWAEGRKINQRFGNVTIELALRNDSPNLLTYLATSYSDHLYAQPDGFHELMHRLLS